MTYLGLGTPGLLEWALGGLRLANFQTTPHCRHPAYPRLASVTTEGYETYFRECFQSSKPTVDKTNQCIFVCAQLTIYLLLTVSCAYGQHGQEALFLESNSPAQSDLLPSIHGPDKAHLAAERRMNATFVIRANYKDIDATIRSIRSIEDRFNRFYGYPYVVLSDVQFLDTWKA